MAYQMGVVADSSSLVAGYLEFSDSDSDNYCTNDERVKIKKKAVRGKVVGGEKAVRTTKARVVPVSKLLPKKAVQNSTHNDHDYTSTSVTPKPSWCTDCKKFKKFKETILTKSLSAEFIVWIASRYSMINLIRPSNNGRTISRRGGIVMLPTDRGAPNTSCLVCKKDIVCIAEAVLKNANSRRKRQAAPQDNEDEAGEEVLMDES
ncbi:hypothetical protein BC629DRAFT_1725802 [Irpex lacteus]|nr:hypothetical protein BC629DRAFT_1725802 [Irpex lacteus]